MEMTFLMTNPTIPIGRTFKTPLLVLSFRIFLAYFGQDVPHGDLSDKEIMAKLACLWSGYELWANTTEGVIDYVENILTIMDEIKAPEMIKQYLDPARNDKSLQLAMANGPFGAMTNVQSDDYPLATHVLKKKSSWAHR